MAANTPIEWADHTSNFWTGCSPASPGCKNCYAAAWAKRAGRDFAERRRTTEANRRQALKWNAHRFMECGACGWRGHIPAEICGCGGCGSIDHLNDARSRVFANSLSDVFDNQVPQLWRTDLFGTIHDTPNLDWLVLTKRIGNAARMLREDPPEGVDMAKLKNLWLGATVVNQEETERDIPKLLATPAARRFLSIEPMLGPVDLNDFLVRQVNAFAPRIDWVIVGGESGPGARSMVLGWAKDIVRQCKAAGVPVLVKQLGARPTNREGVIHIVSDRKGAVMSDWPEELRVREFPEAVRQ